MSKQVRNREKFRKFKFILLAMSKIYSVLPMNMRVKLFELHRMTKGIKGIAIRYALIKSITPYCGENVAIHSGVYIFSPYNLNLGNNISIHPMSYIDATGGINIGSDVSIAHGSTIMSTSHVFENITIPIKDQGIEKKKTFIKDDVWIGAKSTILYGVTIEQGSIIAANTVITKDVDKYSVMAGAPAKKIKSRA